MDEPIYIPGPKPSLELIYSDVWLPPLYSRRILCFALPPDSTQQRVVDVVQRGLSALVRGVPELGGMAVITLSAPHSKDLPWRAIEPYKGVELVVKDLSKTFMSFQDLEKAGYPLSAFRDDLLMPVASGLESKPLPQGVFQLTFIDGGVLLSVCILHYLTDGNGMNTIMRALGEECARAASTTGDIPPRVLETDRSVLRGLKGDITDVSRHPAYRIVPGFWRPAAKAEEPVSNGELPSTDFLAGYYRIEHEQAAELKARCSINQPVSTHDAIAALLWRTLIKCRVRAGRLKAETISIYTLPNNARKHVGLAKEWVGNCVYFTMTSIPVSDIIEEDSLPMMAASIRNDLNAVNAEIVSGLFHSRQKDPYSHAWWPFMEINDPDGHVIAITSFYHSELLGTNWGSVLGEVKHFTSTDIGAMGSDLRRGHFVGPRLPGGKGCDVYVGSVRDEHEYFQTDPLWNKYFRPVEKKVMVDEGMRAM